MHIPQVINITLASGVGNGVTSNKRVSSAHLRVQSVEFISDKDNAGDVRVGISVFTNPGESNNNPDGSFANPTDPLTRATSLINLSPNTSRLFEITPNQLEQKGRFDLFYFWVQGDSANDIVKVIYHIGIDR